MAEEFQPTEKEILFLKAKRAADQASKVDLDIIKPFMSPEDRKLVADRIKELWTK
jgi:hypothetical protein